MKTTIVSAFVFAIMLANPSSFPADTSRTLQSQYGQPISETYLVRPEIAVSAQYGSSGHACAIVVKPVHPTHPLNSHKNTVGDYEQVTGILSELVPQKERGKYVIGGLSNLLCAPADIDCGVGWPFVMLSASRLHCHEGCCNSRFGLATITWAQSANPHPDQGVSKTQSSSPAKKSLTAKQELWCPVLESALGGAAAADPPMRSYLLDAVAAGLSKCDPGKVRTVLVDSFVATLAITENEGELEQFASKDHRPDQTTMQTFFNHLEIKQRLQEVILTQLLSVDEFKFDSLLSQAEPMVRGELSSAKISRAITAKRFNRAMELLNRIRSEEEFPYQEATQLMLELPPEREADKQEVFRLAMARGSESRLTGGDDFAGMIVRFWRHVPPAIALEAIHQVLDSAERRAGSGVTLNATSGNAGFTSEYDYRLFELWPVLKELDDQEADKLLKDSQQAQLQLKQFPNGIQSVDPSIGDTPAKEGEAERGLQMSFGRPNQTGQDLERSEARVKEIGRMAEDNPRQALAAAATLPESVPFGFIDGNEFFPRAQAYVAIARAVMKKNPSTARDALEEMATTLKNAAHPYHALEHWGEGMTIAKDIGEADLAVKLFRSGMEQVDKLRAEDTDSDNPNLALKAWWPSVSAYWWLVKAAAQFSPRTALEQVRAIKDPEIVAVLEVKLADNGLGAKAEESITMVSKARTPRNSWSEFRAAGK